MRRINIKQKNSYIMVFPILILMLFLASTIYFSVHLAMIGDKLVRLSKNESDLSKINRELSLEIIKSTSLSQLSNESSALGFGVPSNIVYLKAEETVAKLPF
jgi:hypothetical protein